MILRTWERREGGQRVGKRREKTRWNGVGWGGLKRGRVSGCYKLDYDLYKLRLRFTMCLPFCSLLSFFRKSLCFVIMIIFDNPDEPTVLVYQSISIYLYFLRIDHVLQNNKNTSVYLHLRYFGEELEDSESPQRTDKAVTRTPCHKNHMKRP